MRKINRRDFLKAAGILAAASALTACGGSDSSSAAAGSGAAETAASLPAINEIKLGEDFQDVTADIMPSSSTSSTPTSPSPTRP